MTTEGRTANSEQWSEELVELRRAQALHAGEARVLEMIAEDAPLAETLRALARAFEAHADGMLATVLLVEDGRVRHGASPSLPEAWARAVDGEPIGPNRGSCGTAAFLKEPVIVSDIEHDPRWALYAQGALALGLRACWSIPVLDQRREVLGTFAFYYTSPREPTAALLGLATRASHIVTVAIERHRQRAQEQRLERELAELRGREQLHAVLDLAPSAVAITRDGTVRYANRKFVELFGFGVGGNARDRVVDTSVRDRILADIAAGRPAQDIELKARSQSGELLDLLAAYRPFEYEHLPSVLLYLVDVTRLKEAQRTAEVAMRTKTVFLNSMSHEIRTPLNAILGYAQLLQRDGNLTDEQRRTIDVVDSSGRHLLKLINDLLTLAATEQSGSDGPATHAGPNIRDTLADDQDPEPAARASHLAALVPRLPGSLVQMLRTAAVEARAGRIGELAKEARAHSEDAALEIERLVEEFRYETLLDALKGGEHD